MAKKDRNAAFEISFYEKVLERAPGFVEALVCLGDLYTKEGFYDKGLAVDQKLAVLRPEDPVVLYNLACSYSLLGAIPAARQAMLRAIEFGYDEWQHLLEDADLANLRADGEFMARLSECRSFQGDGV
ncbi:MAG: hypothetical protein WCO69_06155 [Candidatus Omnitrophota bacterium]